MAHLLHTFTSLFHFCMYIRISLLSPTKCAYTNKHKALKLALQSLIDRSDKSPSLDSLPTGLSSTLVYRPTRQAEACFRRFLPFSCSITFRVKPIRRGVNTGRGREMSPARRGGFRGSKITSAIPDREDSFRLPEESSLESGQIEFSSGRGEYV